MKIIQILFWTESAIIIRVKWKNLNRQNMKFFTLKIERYFFFGEGEKKVDCLMALCFDSPTLFEFFFHFLNFFFFSLFESFNFSFSQSRLLRQALINSSLNEFNCSNNIKLNLILIGNTLD